jgi:hypothetical protein
MKLASSLRLLWIRGLTDSVGPRSFTTDKFIQPKYVTVSGADEVNGLRLYAGNAANAVAYFSHEADRFASASFESLITGKKIAEYPRSTAWLLIRAYYSAFFAAHALLRIHGWACTRLLPNTVTKLNIELGQFFPDSPKLVGGLYLLRLLPDTRELVCKKLDGANQGGTHEALWSVLDDYLKAATTAILSVPDQDHQEFALLVDQFNRTISKFGGSTWFTQLRNRINYSHEYGAWFPYEKSTCDYDRLETAIARWKSDPADALKVVGEDELVIFMSACAFLVGICSATIRDLSYRSRARSPFRTSSGLLLGQG